MVTTATITTAENRFATVAGPEPAQQIGVYLIVPGFSPLTKDAPVNESMTAEKFDIRTALANPKEAFGTPEQVLADPRLDREDKRAILRSWAQDAHELSVAEEEGMMGGEQSMLQRVLRALATLPEDDFSLDAPRSGRDDAQALPLVRDLMRAVNEVVHVDQDLYEAYVRMRHFQIPFLPVVDGDEIVGILTARDIYGAPHPAEDGIRAAKVRDHLTTEIAFCYENDDVETAKVVMDQSGHHRLLVTDSDENLVGLITLETITAALRHHGSGRSSVPRSEPAERIAETSGRAKVDKLGKPRTYALMPKIKK